ncbi:MAG: type III PLP-dependent enzyme [Candidatus Saccharimonadales bacterium]
MSPQDATLFHKSAHKLARSLTLDLHDLEKLREHVSTLSYPTPFFFTSRALLKRNYQAFTDLFDNAEVFYALKANSDPKVLLYLDELGCGFEAASAFEIDLLLKLGVNPNKIIYGTSIKPAEHIRRSFQAGVHRFAADSREELQKIAENAPGAKVFVRAIVDDSGSVFMMSERFGTPLNTVQGLLMEARDLGLKVYGISFYVGSQATDARKWANGILAVRPIIEELYKDGIELEILNIGGGFPVPYRNHQQAPELPEIVGHIHNALHQLPYIPKLLMEPGRGIVATTTVLVSEVIARNNRAGVPWLCMDAGIYNALYEAMIHQGTTQYPVRPLIDQEGDVSQAMFTLSGPTGDSLDIVARDVILPDYLSVGDKLIFDNAGAYTVTMASPFNGFPPPELYIG